MCAFVRRSLDTVWFAGNGCLAIHNNFNFKIQDSMLELMLQFLFLHCDREAGVLRGTDYISQLFYLIYTTV